MFPSSSTSAGLTPKKGSVAEPGLVGVAPGKGEIMTPPVSVCHQVSTMGHFDFPTTSLYQFHSGDLMGSPTVPRMRSEERSCRFGQSSPSFIKARKAVGAV